MKKEKRLEGATLQSNLTVSKTALRPDKVVDSLFPISEFLNFDVGNGYCSLLIYMEE